MNTATPVIEDPVWDAVRREAAASAADEPLLASFLHMTVLRHRTLEAVLSFHLSTKLATSVMDSRALMENAAAIAHSSITGARVHMRRIIW